MSRDTQRLWRYRGRVHFDPSHWSKGGFDLHTVLVPHEGSASGEWEAVFTKTEELGQQVVAAVNACAALGLEPAKLEAKVGSLLAHIEKLQAALEIAVFACLFWDYGDGEPAVEAAKRWRDVFRPELAAEHSGDCTDEAHACARCQAEDVMVAVEEFRRAAEPVQEVK